MAIRDFIRVHVLDRIEVCFLANAVRYWRLYPRIVRRYGLSSDAWILDVGCGDGRDLLPLRELGYWAEGVDPHIPRDVIDQFGVRVHRCEVSEVDGQYDLILIHNNAPVPNGLLKTGGRVVRVATEAPTPERLTAYGRPL